MALNPVFKLSLFDLVIIMLYNLLNLFTYGDNMPIWIILFSIITPIGLMIINSFSRKLIRSTKFEIADFFLGVDAIISSITAEVLKLLEIFIYFQNNNVLLEHEFRITIIFIPISFFFLFLVITFHQEEEAKKDINFRKILFLLIFSNLIGIAIMSIYVLLLEGII